MAERRVWLGSSAQVLSGANPPEARQTRRRRTTQAAAAPASVRPNPDAPFCRLVLPERSPTDGLASKQ